MRERGAQSRRARVVEPGTNPAGSPSGGGPGFWPAFAIIAVIVATAGWTTVGVLVLNEQPATAAAPTATDESVDEGEVPPEDVLPDSHMFPDLEALLPAEVDGTPLAVQSFTGEDALPDDSWGQAVTAFLSSVGKTPADLQAARASDPEGLIDLESIWAFRLADVAPEQLRDAIIDGWRVDYPELVASTATVLDKAVTKGSFGEDAIGSVWYINDGVVFDIESYDEALSTSILAALPPASTVPPASAPAASTPASESDAPSASSPS